MSDRVFQAFDSLSVARDDLRAMPSYQVAPAEGLIKLDAMESPYLLPLPMREQLAQLWQAAAINRYPGDAALQLAQRMKQWLGLPADFDVLLGNGSDELIGLISTVVAKPGACVLAVEPSFVMYRYYAMFAQVQYRAVNLQADFSLDLPATLQAIEQHQPSVVWLAYPNNPTGNLFDEAALEQVIAAAPGWVVVDEAYQAFAKQNWQGKLAHTRKVLLLRTFSKSSLAGARFGYLAGPSELMQVINKVRPPYNVNTLTLTLVDYLLDRVDVLWQQAELIKAERERMTAELGRLAGCQVFPSQANFLLVRTEQSADALFADLKKHGLLVKNISTMHPLLRGCLRITVSSPAENQLLLDAYQKLIR